MLYLMLGVEFLAGIPLWVIFIVAIIGIVLLWKLIKFAIKLVIIVIVFFAILIGLDLLGVFTWIQDNILSMLLYSI